MSFFDSIKENYFRTKGQKYLVKRKIEKAYPFFQKALLINSSPENLFNISVSLMSLQKFAEAEKYLQKNLENHPHNELNLLALAECEMMLRKWNDAIKIYQKLVEINPQKKTKLQLAKNIEQRENYVKSKELLTVAITLKKDFSKSLKLLKEANKLAPQNAYILHNIGAKYFSQKDWQNAEKYFMKAFQINKNNKNFQNSLAKVKQKLR